MTEDARKKQVERVLKLFKLGDASRNANEAEVMLAITKARELMAQYDLTQADLEAYGSEKAKQVAFTITQSVAYTRKGRSFAKYDDYMAWAVNEICGVRHYVQTRFHAGSWVISRVFYGAEGDVAVANELFVVLLDTLRRHARQTYGSGWSGQHTSYGLGFANRVYQRAKQWNPATALPEAQSTALMRISQEKSTQIERWANTTLQLKKNKARKLRLASYDAYAQGYEDGANVDLGNPRRRVK